MNLIRMLIFMRLVLLACLLTACQYSPSGDTTVYLVRHAKKDLTDPSASNPALTPAGIRRAEHLAQKLQSVRFDAIYSTAFERTQHTVKPLATRQQTPVTIYEGHDYPGIQQLITINKGKTILICGHSDNLLPIIRNAGAQPPLDSIGSTEYGHLFKLTIHPDGRAQATEENFN